MQEEPHARAVVHHRTELVIRTALAEQVAQPEVEVMVDAVVEPVGAAQLDVHHRAAHQHLRDVHSAVADLDLVLEPRESDVAQAPTQLGDIHERRDQLVPLQVIRHFQHRRMSFDHAVVHADVDHTDQAVHIELHGRR